MNKKKTTFFSAGISTILLVFVLLCLITFAVLSLATANADYKLSGQTAERVKEYYGAQSEAAGRLKEIDGLLLEQYNNSKDQDEFEEKVLQNMSGENNFQIRNTREGVRITFSQKIGEEKVLEAELAVCYPKQEGDGLYRIQSWKSVPDTRWEPETTLPVMQ